MKSIWHTNRLVGVVLFFITIHTSYSQNSVAKFHTLKSRVLNNSNVDYYYWSDEKVNSHKEDENKGTLLRSYKDFIIDSIQIKPEFIGDLNNNGVKDIFTKYRVNYFNAKDTYNYYGLIELEGENVKVISYLNDFFLNIEPESVKIKSDTIVFNKTINFHGTLGNLSHESSITINSENSLKITSECGINDMKNMNIFKDSIDVVRTKGINSFANKTQNEYYENEDFKIECSLSGCNYLILSMRIHYKGNKLYDFENYKETFKILEFLQTNTRFKTVYTKIEKVLFDKYEENNFKISYKQLYEVNENEKFYYSQPTSSDGGSHSVEFNYFINYK